MKKPPKEQDIKNFEPKIMTPEEQFNCFKYYNQMVKDRLEEEERRR